MASCRSTKLVVCQDRMYLSCVGLTRAVRVYSQDRVYLSCVGLTRAARVYQFTRATVTLEAA